MTDSEERKEELEEIDRSELDHWGVIVQLGAAAARSLKECGTATFFIDKEEKVAEANPAHVYLEALPLSIAPKKFRWVRPILSDGKPRLAAWRDGTLWEIEPEDD